MIIKSQEEYDKFITALLTSTEELVAFDVETSPFDDKKNLKPWELELYGLGLYTPTLQAYIPKKFLDIGFQAVIEAKELVGHHSKFDVQVLEANGYDFQDTLKLHDSLIAAWLCNENRQSYKLKDLALSILKVKEVTRYSDMTERPTEDTKEFTEWEEAMGTYCLADVNYTYRLYRVFEKKMKTDGLWKLYDEVERPLIKVVSDMERTGITVDVKYLEGLKVKLEEELEVLKTSILATIKKEMKGATDDFNVGSTKQLGEYLFKCKKYKMPEDYVTPGGKPSTNEAALKYLAETYKCEVATGLLKFRELNKTLTGFVNSILEKNKGGVIHCNLRQNGTVTGRFSSSGINTQQIPREAGEFNIRAAFVPRPGYVFVDADYSQFELRIGAYLSGCKPMIEAFKKGKDLHQMTADAIGIDRSTAKTTNFSIFYGISGWGLSKRLGVSEEKADHIIGEFFKKFPEIRDYLDESARMLRTQYYVATELGRRRRFPEYIMAKKSGDFSTVGRCERQSGNARIQSANADFTKIAMVASARELKPLGARLLLTVHDELIIEVPEDRADEASKVLKNCMESACNLGEIPVIAQPRIMARWEK